MLCELMLHISCIITGTLNATTSQVTYLEFELLVWDTLINLTVLIPYYLFAMGMSDLYNKVQKYTSVILN